MPEVSYLGLGIHPHLGVTFTVLARFLLLLLLQFFFLSAYSWSPSAKSPSLCVGILLVPVSSPANDNLFAVFLFYLLAVKNKYPG